MGKKGGGKKGGKGGKGGKASWAPIEVPNAPMLGFKAPSTSSFLTLQVRGVGWRVMDFTVRVPASMCVFDLKSLIEQRHGGGVTEFKLYKDEAPPQGSELIEPSIAIGDLDFSVAGDDPRIFYYTFEPRLDDCPLLLRPPHDLKVEALHRAEREEKEAKEARYAALKGGSMRSSLGDFTSGTSS